MISDKYKELIERLSLKTEQKQIIWQKSSRDGEFKLQLGGGTLTVGKFEGDYNYKPSISIIIYNDRGDKIDAIDVEDSMHDYLLVDEFYSSIRRSYFKVDETIES
ncbi:MAG TPA: hypothetical protein VNW06_05190, partial [Cytophagaceae bacterium]|nr:hypothetical protein [Cytophagaceae bacterium]